MKRQSVWLLLAAFLLLISCGKKNSVEPAAVEPVSETAGLQTFVVNGMDDPRLPVPMAEEQSASELERAFLDNFGAGSNLVPLFRHGRNNPAVFWNELTTELGRKAGLPPPRFARAYALTQVAIYDALVVARDIRRRGLGDDAVSAGAASEVLFYLFPLDSARIKEAIESQLDDHRRGNTRRGWFLGKIVGHLVVLHGQSDGSDAVFTGTPPTGDGIWTGTNPVLPMCGTWKTWIITSGDEFQPEAPYAFGSANDLREVEEVYDASFHRTPEQIAIVHKWADLPPPTIWNGYLNERLTDRRWSALRSARAHAYLNVTMYDAFVCCWKTKYEFWTARPFQRLAGRTPAFTTVITTPNFPSYTSGHSTISGAAAPVMGELFPREAAFFEAEAQEAALSRFWGGIHFHKDDNQGLVVGEKIGNKSVRRMHRDGNDPILAGR